MGTFSVGGLSTGLDTKSIIDQLMAIETRPKTKLEWNKALWEARKNSWSDLNTRLNSLQQFANALTNPATWAASTGTTSSDPSRLTAATTGPKPASGTYSVDISQLATTEVWSASSALSGATAGVRQSGVWRSSLGGVATAATRLSQLRNHANNATGLGNNSTIQLSWEQGGQRYNSTFLVSNVTTQTLGDVAAWAQGQIPGSTVSVLASGQLEITSPAGTDDEITSFVMTAKNSGGGNLNAFNGATGAGSSMVTPASDGGAAASETLTIQQGSNTWYVNVAAGDNEVDLVNKINGISGIGVQASIDGGFLKLSALDSGAAKSFTVSGSGSLLSTIGMGETTAGVDASFSVNGTAHTSAKNSGITGVLTDVSLDLLNTTGSSVSLTIGSPGATTDDIKKKINDFVNQYNSVLDFVQQKTDEKRVANPKTLGEYLQGPLSRDFTLSSVAFDLRRTLTNMVDGLPNGMKSLADIGITTGPVSSTFSAANVSGKLVIDDAKLTAALNSNQAGVKDILARVGGGPATENGVAKQVAALVSQLRTGGKVDGSMQGATTQIAQLQTSIERFSTRLENKRSYLERMFSALETRVGKMQQQGAWLNGQLGARQ